MFPRRQNKLNLPWSSNSKGFHSRLLMHGFSFWSIYGNVCVHSACKHVVLFIGILHYFWMQFINFCIYIFFISPNNTILTLCDLFSGSWVSSVHSSGRQVFLFSRLIGTDNRLTISSEIHAGSFSVAGAAEKAYVCFHSVSILKMISWLIGYWPVPS